MKNVLTIKTINNINEIVVGKTSYIVGDDNELSDKIFTILERYISKTKQCEYEQENNYEVYLNESRLNPTDMEVYRIDLNLGLENIIKLKSNTLLLNSLEEKTLDISRNDTINTINSLIDIYNSENNINEFCEMISTDEIKFNLKIPFLDNKGIVKMYELETTFNGYSVDYSLIPNLLKYKLLITIFSEIKNHKTKILLIDFPENNLNYDDCNELMKFISDKDLITIIRTNSDIILDNCNDLFDINISHKQKIVNFINKTAILEEIKMSLPYIAEHNLIEKEVLEVLKGNIFNLKSAEIKEEYVKIIKVFLE